MVANVDQVVIVISLVEPELKPHLMDRYLASAEQGGITPIICLNKADRVDPARYQPLVGFYSQLGILTLLTSAATGLGIDRLRERLPGRCGVLGLRRDDGAPPRQLSLGPNPFLAGGGVLRSLLVETARPVALPGWLGAILAQIHPHLLLLGHGDIVSSRKTPGCTPLGEARDLLRPSPQGAGFATR